MYGTVEHFLETWPASRRRGGEGFRFKECALFPDLPLRELGHHAVFLSLQRSCWVCCSFCKCRPKGGPMEPPLSCCFSDRPASRQRFVACGVHLSDISSLGLPLFQFLPFSLSLHFSSRALYDETTEVSGCLTSHKFCYLGKCPKFRSFQETGRHVGQHTSLLGQHWTVSLYSR